MSGRENTALKVLKNHKSLVWEEIQKYLEDPKYPRQFGVSKKHEHLKKFHWKIVSDYPKRKGKYLRPTLLMLVAKAMGATNNKSLKTAAAMQISEEWLLVHDDIQDKSPMRRGKPSLHEIYGPELALNAGDTLHAIMWKILLDNTKLAGQKKARLIMDEFSKIIMRTTLGQTVDIKWYLDNKPNLSDDDWFFVADSKSSYYSITAPMRLGAIIAGANDKQLDKLAEFGLNLGRSFQLVDDILDVASDFKGLKQKGNDIYEGKRTIILGHLLRTIGKKEKAKILSTVGKSRDNIKQKEVNWIISLMESNRSIDYARSLAKRYKNNADEIFEKDLRFLGKQPHRNELKNIFDFIVERDH